MRSPGANREALADGLEINEGTPEIASQIEKTVLKRNLSLFSGISFIIGIVVGKKI